MITLTKYSVPVSKRWVRSVAPSWHNYRSLSDNVKPPEEVPTIKTNFKRNMLKAMFTGIGKYKRDYLRQPHFDKMYKTYGPVVSRGEIGQDSTIVQLFHPKDVETLFRSEDHTPTKNMLEPIQRARKINKRYYSSKSLLFSNGDVWYTLRKKTNEETLKALNVDRYCPVFDQAAKEFVDLINTITDDNGIVESLIEETFKWSTESICWYLFGRRFGAMEIDANSSKSEIENISTCVTIMIEMSYKLELGFPWYKWFPTPSFWKIVRASRTLAKIIHQNIDSMLNEMRNTTKSAEKNSSFMMYMLSRDDVDEQDIIASVTDLMSGGIDTTSTLTSMLIYQLSKHAVIQDKAYSEIMNVAPNPNAPITSTEINQLHYLRACMKETHRLSPIVDGTSRVLKKDHVFSGYRVPSGTRVVIHHNLMGRTFFDEPQVFKPERWLKNESDIPNTMPFKWLPFGHGTRMCPGRRITQLETMILLTRILQKYQVSNLGDENIQMVSRSANIPNKPIRIKFDRRG